MSDKGYSREGLFGQINHYDEHGHKIGESWPGLFGGYTNYDADGHKTGRSEEQFLGAGYTHYDNQGHKIGRSDEGFLGGYNNYNADGHYTGHTDRSIFDIDEESMRRTGSLYRKSYDPPRSSYGDSSSSSGYSSDSSNTSTGGTAALAIIIISLIAIILISAEEKISVGIIIAICALTAIMLVVVFNGTKKGIRNGSSTIKLNTPSPEEEQPQSGKEENASEEQDPSIM